jgi:hypothetical protein
VLLIGVMGTSKKQECRMSVTGSSDGDVTVTGLPYECY